MPNLLNYKERYVQLIEWIFGPEWATLSPPASDGIIGVCIIAAILDGARPKLKELAKNLGLSEHEISQPYARLAANGVFLRKRIVDANSRTHVVCKLENDRQPLERNDITAWCYYAGYASGDTGTSLVDNGDIN